MEDANFLIAVANSSIAAITFTALVLVLRQLVGGRMSPFHVLMIQMFAANGFGILFFSYLPFLLTFLGLERKMIWCVSSGLLAFALLWTFTWYFLRRRAVSRERPQNVGTVGTMIVFVAMVPVLALHAFGFIYEGSIGPYALGLVFAFFPILAGFMGTLSDFLAPES